jgi:TonB-dependent starch-binding outer membrane protein SusC
MKKSLLQRQFLSNLLKGSLILFHLVILHQICWSQQPADDIRVQGTVSTTTGSPIQGVSVKVKGKNLGSRTNEKGEFSVSVSPNATLVFTHVSHKRQEVDVSGRTTISITLEDSTASLEDVTVVGVGYGTVRRSDLTGAVSSVKLSGVNETKAISVAEALQGKIAGVQIITNTGEPGSGMTFNIRGRTSVTGSNQPLIVIDGQPIESSLGSTNAGIALDGGAEIPPADPLASLNPNDIASIEILKDASSIAIYGSRGANGVVLITTKSGRFGGDHFTYTNRFDASRLPKQLKLLSTTDYMRYRNEAYLNDGGPGLTPGDPLTQPYPQPQFDSIANSTNINWQDEIYRTAISQDHQLSFSGRDAKSNYLISGNYSDQQSILLNAFYKRYGVRINYERQVSNRLTVGIKTYFSLANRQYGQQSNWTGIFGSSAVGGALAFNPIQSAFDASGNIDETYANNPLLIVTAVKDRTNIRTLISNLTANYKITKNLSYELRGGVNSIYSLRNVYFPTGTFIGNSAPNGSATRADNDNSNYLVDNILTYKNTFSKKHYINAVAGFSYQSWRTTESSVTNTNFPSNSLTYYNMASAAAPGRTYTTDRSRALASVLSRFIYSFDQRYNLTFTARYDGASRLAAGNKWKLFPSIGVGWNVSNEKWFNKGVLSQLKFRASYGTAGNENIAIGATQATYGINYVVVGSNIIPSYVLGSFQNNLLGWENTKQLNIGTDFSLTKNRIGFSIDVYQKNTTKLLINLPLPGSAGYLDYFTNLGEIQNRGIDIEGTFKVMQGAVKWDAGINFSIFDNKVIDIGASDVVYGRNYLVGGNVLLAQPIQVAKVGNPISSFWGYKTAGIYQNQDEINKGPEATTAKPGDIKWVDVSGDSQISEADKTIIGNPAADFNYGFTTSLAYKKFTLNLNIFGSYGAELVNINRWIVGSNNTLGNFNLLQDAYDGRWHGEGTSNLYPRLSTNPVRLKLRFPDWMVENASFIRLQNVTLGYNFSLPKSSKITSFRVYATGTNLITLTPYTGYDPNVNAFGQNSINSGVDLGTLPQPRTFSAGIEISF